VSWFRRLTALQFTGPNRDAMKQGSRSTVKQRLGSGATARDFATFHDHGTDFVVAAYSGGHARAVALLERLADGGYVADDVVSTSRQSGAASISA
jgi:hypothetical protein